MEHKLKGNYWHKEQPGGTKGRHASVREFIVVYGG